MNLSEFAPWLALAGLGAYHGVNPAMGWLFAVSLGLQEQRAAAVWRAFIPIALGHAASVAVVVAAVVLAGAVVPIDALKIVAAVAVIGFGAFKLLRPLSHPNWTRMRVGFRALTAWSFLMASAHGAGLMLAPILFNLPAFDISAIDARQLQHAEYMSVGAPPSAATLISQLTAVSIHTIAMFSVMAATAIAVYEKVGLAILRRAWFNLDRLWAAALILSGVALLAL